MLSRARRLSSASTTHQGESLVSVYANISSLAWEYSTQRMRLSRSIGLSFHRLERVLEARLEPLLLLLVADAEPVLEQDDAAADEHALELRAGAEELPHLVLAAEPHDALDAGAVVPGAVEEDDLAGRRQVLRRSAGSTTPCARARSGVARATMRTTRGLRCSVMRLMVPPLPAASRPSKITATRSPACLIHSCSLTSSICSFSSSASYVSRSIFLWWPVFSDGGALMSVSGRGRFQCVGLLLVFRLVGHRAPPRRGLERSATS